MFFFWKLWNLWKSFVGIMFSALDGKETDSSSFWKMRSFPMFAQQEYISLCPRRGGLEILFEPMRHFLQSPPYIHVKTRVSIQPAFSITITCLRLYIIV